MLSMQKFGPEIILEIAKLYFEYDKACAQLRTKLHSDIDKLIDLNPEENI